MIKACSLRVYIPYLIDSDTQPEKVSIRPERKHSASCFRAASPRARQALS